MEKIKWKVDEEPTGLYRSFVKRCWPTGSVNDRPAVAIRCEDSYTAAAARGEIAHAPLHVLIADWRKPVGFDWRKLKGEFPTLKEAKEAAQKFLDAHPEVLVNI